MFAINMITYRRGTGLPNPSRGTKFSGANEDSSLCQSVVCLMAMDIIIHRRGTGLPNPSRGTKFSGANGDRENFIYFPCPADHEQDWQPYPVDPYSAICDGHTYIPTYVLTYTYIHTYTHTYIHTYIHSYIHTYKC